MTPRQVSDALDDVGTGEVMILTTGGGDGLIAIDADTAKVIPYMEAATLRAELANLSTVWIDVDSIVAIW